MTNYSQESTAMDLREAIRSKIPANLERALRRPSSRLELMAKNSSNGAGLLMLAAATGEARMLHCVAAIIKKRVSQTAAGSVCAKTLPLNINTYYESLMQTAPN